MFDDALDFLLYCQNDHDIAVEQIVAKMRDNKWMSMAEAADRIGYKYSLLSKSDIDYINNKVKNL